MPNKSIKTNAILNILKAMLSVIFPLLTYPYATRVLGVENLGKVSFSASIITYFSLVAALGVTTYAIREGAKKRSNIKDLKIFANEIFSINIVTTIFAYSILIIILLLSHKLKEYRLLIIIHSLTIIFTTLGTDWINTIYEDYKYITIRSFIVNTIAMFLLFIFVKNPSDYYRYACLTVLTNAIICICNFFYCKRYLKVRFIRKMNFNKHLRHILIFFANNVAISIYVNADMTMLGLMTNDYYVGLYSVPVKIYSILKNIFAAMYLVTLPRLTNLISNNNILQYKKVSTLISVTIIIILIPSCVGLFILSPEIVVLLSGKDYSGAIIPLQILSVSLFFAMIGGVITQCINISLERERITLNATSISSILNILLNLYFIREYNHIGAAITTAISEFAVLIYCLYKFKDIKEYIDISYIMKNFIIGIVGGGIVLFSNICVKRLYYIPEIRIIYTAIMSIFLYFVFLIISKNEILFSELNSIKKRFKEKK